MSGIKDSERIGDLRDRLYARNAEEVHVERHGLTPEEGQSVPRVWRDMADQTTQAKPAQSGPRVDARVDIKRREQEKAATSAVAPAEAATPKREPAPAVATARAEASAVTEAKTSRSYRWYIVVVSLFILVGGIGFSSFYLLLGLNEISGQNIDVSVSAPSSLGSGETMPIDVTINNRNPAPVVSATLVVNYPEGTQSAEDEGRLMQTERIPLEQIPAGAELEVPVRSVVFGQVDDEKEVNMRLEYRIEGTNSTLERQVDPVAFRITSSPLAVRVDSVERVSAGQDVDIEITVESNAPNTLRNVLVSANYPSAFDFVESSPSPSFSTDTWRIDEIAPGEQETITITGAFVGGQDDEFVMDFTTGVPRPDNQYILGSIFSTTQRTFIIEQPFINVQLAANGQEGATVIGDSDQRTSLDIDLTNTLPDPVYDMYVTVALSGNALDEDTVRASSGFYDSNTDTARFDVTTNSTFTEVPSGARRSASLNITPRQVSGGQVEVDVNVYARRVFEDRTEERLLGETRMTVQYNSVIRANSFLAYDRGPFTNSGPVPPEAEEETTYTVTLQAAAGVNDLVDGRMTTSLPTYVVWQDRYEGPGSVSYNNVNNELTWEFGSVDANDVAELDFQIAFRPSRSQIGQTPALVNQQHLRATDRFTGTVLRETGDPVNTEIDGEDRDRDDGVIIDPRRTTTPEVADDEED